MTGINTADVGDPVRAEGVKVGGLNAPERNLISGNTAGSTGTASYPGSGWVYQGNYIGVAADGLTPIANSTNGGSGALSIDYADDVVVGGPEPTAINIIGASLGHGIAPVSAPNLRIEGNYIGLGYDGTTILGHVNGGSGAGITVSDSTGIFIKDNRVAGWNTGGISIQSGNNDVALDNNIVHNNHPNNIAVSFASSNITIVNNTMYATTISNLSIAGFSSFMGSPDKIIAQSNKIGFLSNGVPNPNETSAGVYILGDPTNVLIGGSGPGEGNDIFGQKGIGIAVSSFTVPAAGISSAPSRVAIMGNSVSGTEASNLLGPGVGIDLLESIDTDTPPDGSPNTFTDLGLTPNDIGDPDTGANNYINFPVLNSAIQEGDNATINFNLDAADSPTDQYRIEFFANDTADPSGYGEGQTFLGAITSSNGANQQTNITLPSGYSLAGKSISATTTAIDNTTASGFGSTSEFSKAIQLPSAESQNLASTGQSAGLHLNLVAVSMLLSTIVLFVRSRLSRRKTVIHG